MTVLSLAARLAERRAALLAAIFCALHPTLLLYTARPFTETMFIFLLVTMMAQLHDVAVAQSGPPARRVGWRAVWAGFSYGLQLLTKNTAILHAVAFLPRLRHSLRGVCMAVAVAALVVTPWVAWNEARFGVPHLQSGRTGITLYHGLYISRHVDWTQAAGDANLRAELELRQELMAQGLTPSAPLAQRDRAAGRAALRWIAEHTGEALRLWGRNLVLTWYLGRTQLSMQMYAMLHGSLWVLALIGSARLWRRRPAAQPLVAGILLLTGCYTGFHAALQPAVRYILPMVPLLAALAAAGLGAVAPRRGESDPRQLRI
jgi:4-amino-4-deoxy-L-arabinose transferase-like glycosyltransferase